MIAARDSVGTRLQKQLGLLGRGGADEGCIFAVNDAEIDFIVAAKLPQIRAKMLHPRGARYIADTQNSHRISSF